MRTRYLKGLKAWSRAVSYYFYVHFYLQTEVGEEN